MQTAEGPLLHYKVRPPRTPAGPLAPLLVLLHGLGADEHDLLPLADLLDGRCAVASVRAPFPSPFGGGYAWYDLGPGGRPDRLRYPQSCRDLLNTIGHLRALPGIDPARVVLLGFSMGAVMSLALALTRPELFLGVSANSGYFPDDPGPGFRPAEAGHLDILLIHGTDDPLIPVAWARAAREALGKTAAHVTYREFPMPHGIGEESLSAVASWLTALLDRTAPTAP